LSNFKPELQELNPRRRPTTVSAHMLSMNLSGLERVVQIHHDLDEYYSKCSQTGVSRERAEQVLAEEADKSGGMTAIETAWRRLIR